MADETVRVQDHLATVGDLCDWLDISEKSLSELITKRVVVRVAHGKYLLKQTVKNYIGVLRRAATGRDGATGRARGQLLSAQARLAEMKEQLLRGDLIRKSSAIAEWGADVRKTKARILSLPGRVSGRLPHLSLSDIAAIAAECNDLLVELADPTTYDGFDDPDSGELPATTEDQVIGVD